MSDVKDILGLSHVTTKTQPVKTSSKKGVNPLTKGLAREVRNLLDGSDENIGKILQQQQFKAKRSRKIKWKRQRIRSSARCAVVKKDEDDLELYHWVKIHNVPDYRYAKLNKTTRMLRYTDVEYEKHLTDPKWSKEETDKLFALCYEFDLRFLVIHDRYNPVLNQLEIPDLDPSAHIGFPFARPGGENSTHFAELKQESTSMQCEATSSKSTSSHQTITTTSTSNSATPTNTSAEQPPQPTPKDEKTTTTAVEMESSPGKAKAKATPNGDENTADIKLASESNETAEPASQAASNDRETPPSTGKPSPTSAPEMVQPMKMERSDTPSKGGEQTTDQNGEGDESRKKTDSNGGDYKTIEELKERFYGVQKLLLQARCVEDGGNAEDMKLHPMFVHAYNAEYESTRREQMELLLQRTERQGAEIAAKVAETKKLDQRMRRVKRQLDLLKRNPRAALGMIQRQRKLKQQGGRKTILKRDLPGYVSATTPLAKIPEECKGKEVLPPVPVGTSLTSYKPNMAPTLRGRVYKQLETELLVLGFNYALPKPFKVPSRRVVESYDALRERLVTLINLNRHVQDREKERDRLKAALRAQNKGTSQTATTQRKRTSGGSGSYANGSSSKRAKKEK